MNYLDYIIDFERVNELTVNEKIDKDRKDSNGYGGAVFSFGISRKMLKEYLSIYQSVNGGGLNRKLQDDKMEHIIKTLHYNKVLISPTDIRDKKIDEILKED